jgi:hypothetical protein
MNPFWKNTLWQQFGASIDMLGNAIDACPDELWSDRSQQPEYWYLVFHTLFWLDFYLSESREAFAPQPPFGLEEMDPAGVLPERVYTKDELKTFLEHGRRKCRAYIDNLEDETAGQRCKAGSPDMSVVELLLYNMRHVQHHAAQLNLILRQKIDSAPGWVSRAKDEP